MAMDSESNWLLDFSQFRRPLNKLRSIFAFSLPPLILRNRNLAFLSSGWHKRPERTIWEI